MTLAIIIITVLVILAVIGQVFTHRMVKDDKLELSQGMIEAMLGVVGTLFSLLLGLLVANAIESYHEINIQVSAEANSLANIYRLCEGLNQEDRLKIRSLCAQYNHCVIHTEWPEMNRMEMAPHCWTLYSGIWSACVNVKPQSEQESNLQASMLDSAKILGETRRARSVTCKTELSPILWAAIFFGSIITIIFTYFFTSKMGRLHTLLTALIAISLGLNIWLLAAYSLPFSSALKIKPQIFEILDRQVFDKHEAGGAQ
ncbi:MAG: DUF4239 domain-containing protein [Candidatus Melainabacteria bacterium]|nr:DUF4239 domain-containing protein [Candidatus Melainabacteria bacterium]